MTRRSTVSAVSSPADSASASTSPARFCGRAPILILDEATSQVDAESEHLIQLAIDSMMQSKDGSADRTTMFVIAHRFSTILKADTIVVMDRGKIVGQGKHEELLRTCATYKQLYERQLFAA